MEVTISDYYVNSEGKLIVLLCDTFFSDLIIEGIYYYAEELSFYSKVNGISICYREFKM